MVTREGIPPQRRDWKRWGVGGATMLIALAVVLIVGRVVLGSKPEETLPPAPPTEAPVVQPLEIVAVDYPTPQPTRPPQQQVPVVIDWTRPTAAAAEIAAALDAPVMAAPESGTIQRKQDPLTIIPERSRSSVIIYTVKKGDNLGSIAERFGLDQSTIIWSNDRFYVNAMRVGLELNILPVDGVYHHVAEPQTITAIAESYQVDPFAIIDSEYNTLFGVTPETILPEGLWVVVPGGKGSTTPIYWDPGIVMTSDSSGSSGAVGAGITAAGEYAAFAVGDPGSCGKQPVVGGTPPVSPPIYARYRITQDFSWAHGGIDLSVPAGTDVFAAGGGTVIFSGWSTWGYGYTVVIAHGSTLSLYGHLNGAFVSCGQMVSAGQGIAVTGSSGRSSGPHLHFEVRGAGGAPDNPWNYMGF
ncbi:MAG: M23 family metallopeptidase [Chloroflexi bacterium]|nr:M23 family metallopeptidase [Chloroflexota bacterium]